MTGGRWCREGEAGTILLPVLLLLLVLASAATAMTLQARTSLREAAIRRTRLSLTLAADGAVRAVALALATATAGRTAPPFAIDGTADGCRIDRDRRLTLTVQDEGGRIDLNKATPDLLLLVLGHAGLGATDANAIADAIVARRDDGAGSPGAPGVSKPGSQNRPVKSFGQPPRGFTTADEIDALPGLTPDMFATLRPLFTVGNGSAGIDAEVAAPAVRAAVPRRELASPALAGMLTPSSHTTFTVTATVHRRDGPRVTREALFRLEPQAGALGRFLSWDTPFVGDPAPPHDDAPFCRRVAAALTP